MSNDNDWEDFEVEDVTAPKPKKKVNGGAKGKRVERYITKILTTRFGKEFSRSVGSGNRWAQTKNMPKHALETFSGDICCPEGFLFTIESKGGYNKIDLNNIFESGNSELDKFLEQSDKEASHLKKKPLLLWKKDHKPWIAFVKQDHIQGEYDYLIKYREWNAVLFKKLLELPDNFFFA